jgi:hypothetical protein
MSFSNGRMEHFENLGTALSESLMLQNQGYEVGECHLLRSRTDSSVERKCSNNDVTALRAQGELSPQKSLFRALGREQRPLRKGRFSFESGVASRRLKES